MSRDFLGSPERAHEHRRRMSAERQTPDPSNDYFPPRPCELHSLMVGRLGVGCAKCERIWMIR